jgi:hypothetical protein
MIMPSIGKISLRKPFLLTALLLAVAGCGGAKEQRQAVAESKVTTIGVNSFLFRAALETLSFMPIQQADANTGILITDWYINPQSTNERVRINAFILDKDLRADALRITAQRQENKDGQWVEASVRAGTVQRLEEIVLTRARQIRQASVPQ